MAVARASWEAPAGLVPADLAPLRAIVGAGALDYALVIGAFHFINRIADCLHVDPDALPAPLRRIELLRRASVRLASLILGRMDLANRPDRTSYPEALARVAPIVERHTGRPVGDAFAPLAERPRTIDVLRLAMEERDLRTTLDRTTLARIHRTVEAALPTCREETQGLHARPADPVEAFAFVGTRYASRTTPAMIAALRRAGYDDLGILDLAIAVADANQWARNHRLAGLAPDLFYVTAADPARAASATA